MEIYMQNFITSCGHWIIFESVRYKQNTYIISGSNIGCKLNP